MKAMAALMLLAAAAGPASIEGTYTGNMIETATGLRLVQGGRYQWYFSQGALDLESEGSWVREGDKVLLTSHPVEPPRFAYVGSRRSAAPGFAVHVLGDRERPVQGVDILVQYVGGEGDVAYTDEDGSSRFEARGKPEFIALALPMFGVRSQDFHLVPTVGDVLTFRFEPHDLGKERFDRQPLAITADGLEMRWRGPTLRYRLTER